MTHICNLWRVATTLHNLQCVGILATHSPQNRDNLVEEEVNWHEEDDLGTIESDTEAATLHLPTRMLELKVLVPETWPSLCYMIERCLQLQ